MTNRLEVTYELDSRWRALAGLTQYRQTNHQPLVDESGYNQTEANAGARYVLPSGSYAGFTFKATDGTYSDRPLSAFSLFDNRFSQTDGELDLNWSFSEKTSADFRVGYRSRTHPNFPQRNFSGMTGVARINWLITGKAALSAGWTRDLGAYQTIVSNFAQTDRFYIGPVWQISPKTKVGMQLASSMRDYRGFPVIVVPTQRRDTNRDASLSFDWQPRSYVSFYALLQNSRRSSNVPGLDFNSNVINLTAQFTY